MDEDQVRPFGGMAGRVLREAMGPATVLTGVILAAFLFLLSVLCSIAQSSLFSGIVSQVFIAVALARFAVNGYAGEWGGSVLSSRGGPWGQVAVVALRFVCLSAVCTIPFVLLGYSPFIDPKDAGILLGPAGIKIMAGLLVFTFVMLLAQPIMLAVSVSADALTEIFSPRAWNAMLRRRPDDIFTLYAVYIGGMAVALLLAAASVLFSALISTKLAWVVAGVSIAFVIGFTVTLMGRLCGLFAISRETESPAPRAVSRGSVLGQADAGFPPRAVPSRGAEAPKPAPGVMTAAQASQPAANVMPAAQPGGASGKPVLLRAPDHVSQAWRRFEGDAPGAIASMEELSVRCAPNPLVLHALTFMKRQAGDADGALAAASSALPVCLGHGLTHLAADLFLIAQPRIDELGLQTGQLLEIGRALQAKGDLKNAANASARVLSLEPQNPAPFKLMTQIADAFLQKEKNPADAQRIFAYLLKACPESPLAEFVRKRLAEAERVLTAAAPAGPAPPGA